MSCSSLSQIIEQLQDTDYCQSCMETEESGPSKAFKIPVGDIFRAGVIAAAVITATYCCTSLLRLNPIHSSYES